MKKRRLITLVVLIVLGVIVYFSMAGFSVDIYDFKPLPQQINLGLDLTGGVYAVFEAQQGEFTPDEFNAKMESTISVLRNRLDEKGYLEATIVRQGSNRIRVEVPINETSEVKDSGKILSTIIKPGFLEFKNAAGETILEGKHVSQAYPSTERDERTGSSSYVVALRFNAEGAKLFGDLTKEAWENGTNITITLDGNTISTAGVNNGPITGGSAVITGSFTGEEVTDLAMQIESGALPLDLNEFENRTISASLGQDALSGSIFAGMVGLGALFIFLLLYYRLPGLVACIALTVYIYLTLFIFAVIPAIQLTLPGVAAIILGLGMAVDANVIIFERFKEELAVGKTLRASMKAGFHKAMSTIIDANVTTIISGVAIAVAGVGTIKGFGYTLIIGIVVSIITAVVLTRWLMFIILDLNIKNRKLYTIRKDNLVAAEKVGE